MYGKKVPLSVVAAAISACAIEPELLNSERIEERFGNYGIEVISSESGLRRSNLYSTENGMRICRTYAVVRFTEESHSSLDQEHEQILAGRSIGAIFKAGGWSIHKETLYIGSVLLDENASSVAELMRIDSGSKVAAHVYRLLLEKAGQAVDYATIIELHHPDYLDQENLEAIYSVDADVEFETHQIEELKTLGLDAA